MDIAQVISLVFLLAVFWATTYFRIPKLIWTTIFALSLVVISLYSHLPLALICIFWLLYFLVALFANLNVLRQRYIVKPLLSSFQKQMPTISPTERTAIEAGDTWWEKELFCGKPRWKKLYQIPRPSLTQEEQRFLDNQVDELCSIINDWDIVFDKKDLPKEVWDFIKKEKFFGMVIPKQYGGLGFSALAHSTVITKLASRSISVAVTTMVPNSLGPGELLLRYGTEDQKNYYLPRLATGEEIPCFALTAPEAGSDAGAIPDVGIVCRGNHDGKEILGIRLSWDKRYITLAPVATVLGVAFHLYDPDKLLGDKHHIGITLCLIPTSHAGVEIGNRHYPMGLAFMNGPTRGSNVFIPIEWIIGGLEMAGQGWRMLMECLSIGRSISLPALSTASCKMTYRLTGAYSRIRKQFNTSLSSFEGIQEALGYIAGYTYLVDACRIMTAGAVDQNINPAIVSAIAKYHLTEINRTVVSHGMDIHGGHMIQTGPRNFLANSYFAIPIGITVEGANILTRNLIIFGQGAIRCHPYLLKEIEFITAKDTNIKGLDHVLMKHVGYFISLFSRCFTYGLTGGKLILVRFKNRKIKKYIRQLTRMSAALALLSDTSLIFLGGSLKRRENISARLGDIMSQLYLASTVLKYFHDNNYPESDIDYVCWVLEECLYRMQIASYKILKNFPNRFIASLFGWIIFPFGQAYFPPNDKQHARLLHPMVMLSDLRDRITQYIYQSKKTDDLGYQLDQALKEIDGVETIIKKLQKNMKNTAFKKSANLSEKIKLARDLGILTADEELILTQYENLKNEIIKVNEFSFDLDRVIA